MNKNYQRDPVLRELSGSFKRLAPFIDTQEGDDNHYAKTLCNLNDDTKLKNITRVSNGAAYCVRLYLGGKSRSLAIAKPDRLYDLCRFADQCVLRFWKYRVRGRVHDDYDFITSEKEALLDLELFKAEMPDVIVMLDNIEEHLKAIGAIAEIEPGTDMPDPRRKPRGQVAALTNETRGSFAALSDDMGHQHKEQKALIEDLASLVRRLAVGQDRGDYEAKFVRFIEPILKAVHNRVDKDEFCFVVNEFRADFVKLNDKLDGMAARLDALEPLLPYSAKPDPRCPLQAPSCPRTDPKTQEHRTGAQSELPVQPFKNGEGFVTTPTC